jgi:hypothetical protein
VACAVLFLVGFAWLAPTISRDWLHVEEAREALGYLICAVSTGLALWTGLRWGARRREGDLSHSRQMRP